MDIVEHAVVCADWLNALAASASPIAQALNRWGSRYVEVYSTVLGQQSCIQYDALTVGLMLHPEAAQYRELPVAVELSGRYTIGQLVADQRPFDGPNPLITDGRAPVRIAVEMQSEPGAFAAELLEAIC